MTKFRSCTLAGFYCTLVDTEEQEEEDDDVDENATRAIPIY